MIRTRFFLAAVAAAALMAAAASAAQKGTAPKKTQGAWGVHKSGSSDPKLPCVLLIGDSIVNGYRRPVTKLLEGKARVDCWITGMNLASGTLRQQLAQVLRAEHYEVIHFNIGLHGWQPGRIPKGQYEPLLRAYVKTLKENAPKAKLIWASTTPVTVKGKPEELDKQIEATVSKRNAIAAKVMKESRIAIDDLNSLMIDKLKLARGDRFHWKPQGYAIMAKAVSGAILDALKPAK